MGIYLSLSLTQNFRAGKKLGDEPLQSSPGTAQENEAGEDLLSQCCTGDQYLELKALASVSVLCSARPFPFFSFFISSGVGPQICISNEFPGDADASNLKTYMVIQ